MQLVSEDAAIFKKKKIAHEMPSKVAHNLPKTTPKLPQILFSVPKNVLIPARLLYNHFVDDREVSRTNCFNILGF